MKEITAPILSVYDKDGNKIPIPALTKKEGKYELIDTIKTVGIPIELNMVNGKPYSFNSVYVKALFNGTTLPSAVPYIVRIYNGETLLQSLQVNVKSTMLHLESEFLKNRGFWDAYMTNSSLDDTFGKNFNHCSYLYSMEKETKQYPKITSIKIETTIPDIEIKIYGVWE